MTSCLSTSTGSLPSSPDVPMFLPPRSTANVTLKFQEDVSAAYESLYREGRLTDVKIAIGGSEFNAHKLVLASQSPFFETMFFNAHMLESRAEAVTLKETDAEIFALLLKVVYGGRLEESEKIGADLLVRLYELLQRYQFERFEATLLQEIARKLLSPANFWQFLDVAVYYDVKAVVELCFDYLESLAQCASQGGKHCTASGEQAALFSSAHFVSISHDTLKVLLNENITCSEMRLLEATQKWIDHNGASITNNEKLLLLKAIRLNIISEPDLVSSVSFNDVDYSDLVEALQLIQHRFDNIIDFYILTNYGVSKGSLTYYDTREKAKRAIVKNRSLVIANYNVCQEDFGFHISSVSDRANVGCPQQFEWFTPSEANDKPVEITICLGFPFLLNIIDVVLSEAKGDKYSYVVEYSVDGFNWAVLFDYRHYVCSNHQTLYFNPIVARYFRLKGFHQTRLDERTRKPFRAVKSFKALYNTLNAAVDVRVSDGVISSAFYTCQIKHRVYCDYSGTLPTTEERYYAQKCIGGGGGKGGEGSPCPPMPNFSPIVGEGCVFRGFKPVLVLFDQPIVLSAFTFRLYDHDPAVSYSYLVDIYNQGSKAGAAGRGGSSGSWDCVADRSTEKCSGWQTIVFSSRPVNIMRIVPIAVHDSPVDEFRILKFNFNAKV
ncbi:BTB/POZ domain-containing protein 9 [Tyrophagus putrescentiae]|nr:BTB/POZ domain-containing protein 9 [Tyrophagus putrescentiae]